MKPSERIAAEIASTIRQDDPRSAEQLVRESRSEYEWPAHRDCNDELFDEIAEELRSILRSMS